MTIKSARLHDKIFVKICQLNLGSKSHDKLYTSELGYLSELYNSGRVSDCGHGGGGGGGAMPIQKLN